MIELKTLTKQQRSTLRLQCETFLLASRQTTKFKSIHSEFMSLFTTKYTKEVWLVITALSKALRYNANGVVFSLDKKKYVLSNEFHGQQLSRDRASYVLEVLDSNGYIKLYKGYYNRPRDRANTLVFLTDRSREMFSTKKVKEFGCKREYRDSVVIRDDKGNNLPTKGVTGISVLSREVEDYNRFLEQAEITINNITVPAEYFRVYSNNLQGGGRWYSKGTFQTQKSFLRKTITINRNETCEVDISQIHPSILACLGGIKLSEGFKAYAVTDKLGISMPEDSFRTLCKEGLMCILNSGSRHKAILALHNKVTFSRSKDKQTKEEHINKVQEKYGFHPRGAPTRDQIEQLIIQLENHNKDLSKRFYEKDLWKVLQNADSEICRYVLLKCTQEGVTALPWHDSWIVQTKDKDFLVKTVHEAWEFVLGTKDNLKLDTK